MAPRPPRPGEHPEPPADLPSRRLSVISLRGPWYRIHRREHSALHFGRSTEKRFDAPAKQYGVLYLGEDAHGAFIEVFGESTGINVVSYDALAQRLVSKIEARRPLTLVNLTGPGLARIGADGRLVTGDYGVAQRWALALWSHPSKPDGLHYRARHDQSRTSVAIFNRVKHVMRATSMGRLVDRRHEELLADILDTYGFALLR